MLKEKKNSNAPAEGERPHQTKITFGVMSAVITNLELITGLDAFFFPLKACNGAP